MVRSETIGKISAAFLKAQKKMGSASKDAKNPYFKSKYADLSSVIDTAVSALNEEGISVLQNPILLHTGSGTKSVLETMLLHESGEYLCSQIDIVSAKENDPQAYGSAISYARRYGLQSMVTMKAEDDDAEGAVTRTTKVTASFSGNTYEVSLPVESTEAKPVAEVKKKVSFSKKAFGATTTPTTSTGDL